jgi:(E)-4-hydroxy-3-methylbut-2-enyl-diphosphate synthase
LGSRFTLRLKTFCGLEGEDAVSDDILIPRRKSREVAVGNLWMGGAQPILVQSMCNVPTRDAKKVMQQINALVECGCELVRVSVPDVEALAALPAIVLESPLPVIADIHFNADIAVGAIEAGVAKVRINPGNIASQTKIKMLAECAKANGVPLRVGANAGSLPKKILDKYKGPTGEAMAEACLEQVALLEKNGFENIVLSVKASDIGRTIAANRYIACRVDYPIHLGVTEAGTLHSGMIKSAIGIGEMLLEGIGDTLRVSLSADPVNEVYAGWEILQHLNLRRRGLRIVACPGCARTAIEVYQIASEVEQRYQNVRGLEGVTVAIMGCAVNGPGEAREADLGVAGLPVGAVFFSKGEVQGKIENETILEFLFNEIDKLITN